MLVSQVVQRQLQLAQSSLAASLIEGDVGFVRANESVCLLNYPAVESELRLRLIEKARRQLAALAVEADAEQRVHIVYPAVEFGLDGGDCVPPSGIEKAPSW